MGGAGGAAGAGRADHGTGNAMTAWRLRDDRAYFEHYRPVITPDRLGYHQRLCPDEGARCGTPAPAPIESGGLLLIFACTLRRHSGDAHVAHIADGSALAAWDRHCEQGQMCRVRESLDGQVRLPLGNRTQYQPVEEYDLV